MGRKGGGARREDVRCGGRRCGKREGGEGVVVTM